MPLNRFALEAAPGAPASQRRFGPFPDEVVEPFTRHLARVLAAPVTALFLKQGDQLVLRCGSGLSETLKRRLEIPYFLHARDSHSPLILIEDTENSPLTRDAQSLRDLGWKSLALLQFGVETGAVAVLCVADVEVRAWTQREGELLTEIAGLILKQVRREQRARDEAMHSRTIEEARSQLEQRFRRLFESSRDAIYMTSPDGMFTDANPSMLEMFGYTREELLQLAATDLYMDEDERGSYELEIEKLGSVRQHEVRLKRKDGTVLDCLKTASVQRAQDNSVIGYQGIIHDITERKRIEQQLAHNAFHDPLTGLPNRLLFLDRLERVVRVAKRRPNAPFAVLFLDLDRFKVVNDTMGHVAGDQLLAAVARRLEGCIRLEDTVARLGGDEFAVIVSAIGDSSDATRVAERVIQEISYPFTIDGSDIHTAASVGVALSYSSNATADSMIRDADAAMYRAKATGRGRYQVFDPLMHTEIVTQMQVEADLRRALQQNEFGLVYQPVIDLESGALAGFEAFLRWNHPERGLLAPRDFIVVAEETGLILPVGWWVLAEACRQMHAWEQQLGEALGGITISVNLSGKQFYQPDLVAQVDRILTESGVSSARIKLEVPENVVMRNAQNSVTILRQLMERGILLSIDDFGTSYSSLSYLQQFPVATLKIDHKFVADLTENGKSGLVASIVALGNSLGVDTLAEGIENQEQLDHLRQLGVRFGQGYHFTAAVDSEMAAELIRKG